MFTLPLFSVSVLSPYFLQPRTALKKTTGAKELLPAIKGGGGERGTNTQRNYCRTLLLSQNSACPLVIKKKYTEEYLEMNYSK